MQFGTIPRPIVAKDSWRTAKRKLKPYSVEPVKTVAIMWTGLSSAIRPIGAQRAPVVSGSPRQMFPTPSWIGEVELETAEKI